MDTKLKEIVLAAWLHDVGKFAQRAGRKDIYNPELEGVYCKQQQGGWYSHQHVIFTQGFLEKYRDVLPDDVNVNNVIEFAAKHHSPSTYEDWIVAQADRLSSGSDRCMELSKEAVKTDETDNPKWFYEKPMLHILSTLRIKDREEPKKAYCKMKPLDEDAIICTEDKKTSRESYNTLWQDFEKDFTSLKGLKYDDFMASLDTLLERYWWCIPSATNTDADISLYQHGKTTAAFAAALYQYQKENGEENESALIKDEEKFRFIKGDISGIQKYIFDLKTNDDSAKLLRAKSFEIAALGELISRYIVNSFELPTANIITSAGGNFMILLPNSKKVQEFLPQVQLDVESYFLKEYAGKLSVIISDGVKTKISDLKQENALTLINKIGYDADVCKQKKMQKTLQKNGAVLEDFYAQLQANGECIKCGTFPADTKGGECSHCKTLTKIGEKLVKTSNIAYKADKLTSLKDMIDVSENPQQHGRASIINSYKAGFPLAHLPYTVPRDENKNVISFADIANKSCCEDKGVKKLAMFKADIDNLGLVFSSSLGKRTSFSRYADMSHTLHYFFSAYFVHFVQTHPEYKNTIYTVFSGGDDLCVIGAWDKVMDFARDFHEELEKLTNKNPSLTLSGGIVLASSSTPVAMIADMAEKALDESKVFKRSDGCIKNAITVFGTTVSWEDYKKSLSDAKKMQAYLEDKTLSTGVIYKMIDFANRAQIISGENEKKIANVEELLDLRARTWKSNFKYIVARNVKDKEAKEWLYNFGTSADEMIKSRIAVSYALYTQRNN